jgi:hypothetical protein
MESKRWIYVKKSIRNMLIFLAVVVAASIAALVAVYSHYHNQTGFLKNTTLNGEDVSGKTPETLVQEALAEYDGVTVTLQENGEEALSGSLSDYGISFDSDAMLQALQEAESEEKASIFSIFRTITNGKDLSASLSYSVDEDTFSSFVSSQNLAADRVESVEGSVELDSTTNTYVVVEPVQGNEIDDSKLQSWVKEQIDTAIHDGTITDSLTLDIPSDVYTSETVDTDTTALEEECAEKNRELAATAYKNMTITYTFGDETEVLDGDTIASWVTVNDDGTVTIDEDQIASYVSDLASKYNTRYLDRTFTTTGGQTITIAAGNNEYGYTIDEEAECAQLEEDIEGKESVTREPCYIETNDYGNPLYLSREGVDDINGTYVEVDITQQHLWFYKDGELVVESDVVTGDVATGQDTQVGCFPLAYKESPSTLSGNHEDGTSYSVEVQYWMPFFEGQGLHDASWRTSFGGTIYQTDGSNGCVNCPSDVAKTIYENIEAGTPIIIYNE